jgi:DNA-binding NarL/FixJ family response regulator
VINLNERDKSIILFLADGMTQKEIADEMCYSPETIKSYVRNLLLKVQAKNAAHLVALSYHKGILIPLDKEMHFVG